MSVLGEELCDLVWQHQHQRRWITYSPDELIVINKALKKCQKTVTLPSINPEKKKLVINFQKMYQRNAINAYEQQIRCILYNKDAYVWMWKEDDYWNCYTARLSLILEIAYQQKQKSIQFHFKDDYKISLENFTQVNLQTLFCRDVKREKVDFIESNPKLITMTLNIFIACERHIVEMSTREDLKFEKIDLDSTIQVQNGIKSMQGHDTMLVSRKAQSLQLDASAALSFIDSHSAKESTECTVGVTKFLPVDSEFTESQQYHIYCCNSKNFNATLNFTDIQNNNNKFYILQLLEHNSRKVFGVWYRWGRVGYGGQKKFIKFGPNLTDAVKEFESKFYNKTGNQWHDIFMKVPGKYDLVFTDTSSHVTSQMQVAERNVASKLGFKLQALIQMICDQKRMEDLMKYYCYDYRKAPLGKLDSRQLGEGYLALNKISDALLEEKSRKELIEACNEFYTKIPHDFGRRIPPLIDSTEAVGEKLVMLEALYNIDVAVSAMNSVNTQGPENPLDLFYKFLQCKLEAVLPTSEEFVAIENCLKTTHGPTHSTYRMHALDIFKCVREKEENNFLNCDNNYLLWHGSRITNWYGILKKGLQIAPPEAPSTGYMFGKGIYFADVASKSANYCFATKKKNEGLLLLSEVSAGRQLSLHEALLSGEEMPPGIPEKAYHSVLGVGRYKPSSFETTVLSSEAKLPCGPLKEVERDVNYTLQYNEYIVYDIKQVKMKYLVKIKFEFYN